MNAALQASLSPARLSRYMALSNNLLDSALSLYERNARLSAAFHTPLQCLEVCLRNNLNRELSTKYGTNWFLNGGPPLQQPAIDKIDAAIKDLNRSGTQITPGAVVAELSFGFWVMILGRKYDSDIWRSCLTLAFLEGGRRTSRQRVHNRMNDLRGLRNRVAHHEPIFHQDLGIAHQQIIEAIAWICPASAAWALNQSQVPHVLANP